MKSPVTLILIVFLMSLFAFSQQQPRPSRIVVLDSWWSVDYAKNACESIDSAGVGTRCEPKGDTEILSFENELLTSFASEEACNGVQVIDFKGIKQKNPKYTDLVAHNSPYWWLMLNMYNPPAMEGEWTVTYRDSADNKNFKAKFKGDATNVARRVCRIVRGLGGQITSE